MDTELDKKSSINNVFSSPIVLDIVESKEVNGIWVFSSD